MLDLIFLVLFIVIIARSLRGYYNEKLCRVAMVIGILAAAVGIILHMTVSYNPTMIYLNMLVLGIAIAQRNAARYFVKLHNDKVSQSQKELEDYIELHSRKRDTGYHMSDEDFDNEEIRFGKGGFKPYDEDFSVTDVTLKGKENPTLDDKE